MDMRYLTRNVNEGFSGGEKKRNEILQACAPAALPRDCAAACAARCSLLTPARCCAAGGA